VNFALQTVDLSKRYGNIEALKSLSFAVPPGEVVAFLGPNSAGKTTTLKILAGIMPASRGEATVAGYSAAYQSRAIKRHVGYMPEHNPLPEEATVEEFLTYRARLKELRGSKVKSRVEEAAGLCDLSGKIMRRPIGVLSRGVRQRVGIADTLLTEPPILLLDEPTIGLDPHQVMALRDLIRSMRGKHTILLSTHILSEAEVMADRILIINKGQKVACGTVEELKAQYAGSHQLNVLANIPAAQMREFLAEVGGSIHFEEVQGGNFRYGCALPKPEAAQELLKNMMKAPGVYVSEFVKVTPTLESIFIQATARKEDA